MRSKLFLSLALAILGVTSARFGLAQSIYSAHENHLPIAVGFGASNFDLDYGRDNSGTERRMGAITSWLDWTPPKVPRLLEGLSVEVEGRDINFGRPSSLPKMRQDTILGGVAYNLPYSHLTHPYIKYLMGMGSIDFPPAGRYSHDTRSVWAPGAGLEVKLFANVRAHADYEYQFWPHIFGPHALNPNGFTFGTTYDFRIRPAEGRWGYQ